MLKKKVTSLLICAALLLAATPSKAFAQTQAQPRPELRAAFSEVKTQAKTGASLEANMKRLETEWLNPKPQAGYTKKEKILVYSIVAGLVVLAVVLALTTKKGGHTFCSTDPTDSECLPG